MRGPGPYLLLLALLLAKHVTSSASVPVASQLASAVAPLQLPAGTSPAPIPCTFSFADAYIAFDLSSLKGAPFSYSDGSGLFTYSFQFCGLLDKYYCGTSPTSSFRALDGACQQDFGRANNATAALLGEGKGLRLTYRSASVCPSGPSPEQYYTTFDLTCDPTAVGPNNFNITSRSDPVDGYGCGVIFEAVTAAACGKLIATRPLGVGWIVFCTVLAIVVTYIVGGIAYKRRAFGARGLESLPNVAFWRAVFHAITCERFNLNAAVVVESDTDYAALGTEDRVALI